jgi:hypothetical protein
MQESCFTLFAVRFWMCVAFISQGLMLVFRVLLGTMLKTEVTTPTHWDVMCFDLSALVCLLHQYLSCHAHSISWPKWILGMFGYHKSELFHYKVVILYDSKSGVPGYSATFSHAFCISNAGTVDCAPCAAGKYSSVDGWFPNPNRLASHIFRVHFLIYLYVFKTK